MGNIFSKNKKDEEEEERKKGNVPINRLTILKILWDFKMKI